MISELLSGFESTIAFIRAQVYDLTDAEMILQPPGLPNHAAWTLGHLIFSFQEIAAETGSARWLPEDWESRYGFGSSPARALSAESSRDNMIAMFDDAARRLHDAVSMLDEDTLSLPLPDEDARAVMPTVGHALLQIVSAHTAFHAGQIAAWRRGIGKEVVGVFV